MNTKPETTINLNSIPKSIRVEIEKQLTNIEADHDVTILFAIESGSRAWGFPSSDSDYDVRFVYIHKRDWYLSLKPGRDVIELPIDDDLDIGGWDLRKALNLLINANPVLQEWLRSPIRYRWNEECCKALLALSDRTSFLPACTYHYRNLGSKQYELQIANNDAVSVKKYFYVVRPALALHWLDLRPDRIPPMNLQELMAGLPDDAVPKNEIEALVEAKAVTKELGAGQRLSEIDAYLERYIASGTKVAAIEPDPTLAKDAETLFRRLLNLGL